MTAINLAAPGVDLRWDVRIPLRDGTMLQATLYFPRGSAEPVPVILTMTPYVAQLWHERGVYFASQGFAFAAVDVRGRGNSEGIFRPLIQESDDGHDVVEWLADQPWCDGQVGMWGGSYGGYAQWATAKARPSGLVTIVPTAPAFAGVDVPFRSNIFSPYIMQWLTLVGGRTIQDRVFFGQEAFWGERFRRWFESGASLAALDDQLGMPSETFQEWLSHPAPDSYWDAYGPTAGDYAAIDMPVLTITGSYDGDQPGSLEHYSRHLAANPNADHYLLIGPWDHAGTRTPERNFVGLEMGPNSLVDLNRLHLDWYRWAMQGGERPAFLGDRVTYYVMVADTWRSVASLDRLTEREAAYHLSSDGNPEDVFHSGRLVADGPGYGGPDHYRHDPRNVSGAALEADIDPESRADQRRVLSTSPKLVYHGAPFEEDIEISGFFRFHAWIAIDTPDADFRVTVFEIATDGTSVLLSTDLLRARYRENLREERLIDTTGPLLYRFERFHFVSRRISAGSRLRLVIEPPHSIYLEKNYQAGGTVSRETVADARTATVTLLHDPSHPSILFVPIGQGD